MSSEDTERAPRDVKNHVLFEIATEVAHRGMSTPTLQGIYVSLIFAPAVLTYDVRAAVGGIYSVIKSKAPVTTAEYGERYTLIGPLNHQSVGPTFSPEPLQRWPQPKLMSVYTGRCRG